MPKAGSCSCSLPLGPECVPFQDSRGLSATAPSYRSCHAGVLIWNSRWRRTSTRKQGTEYETTIAIGTSWSIVYSHACLAELAELAFGFLASGAELAGRRALLTADSLRSVPVQSQKMGRQKRVLWGDTAGVTHVSRPRPGSVRGCSLKREAYPPRCRREEPAKFHSRDGRILRTIRAEQLAELLAELAEQAHMS